MKIRTPIKQMRVVSRRQTYIPHILFVLLCWSLAITFDYHDQAETAKAIATQHEREFTECLKGKWRTVTPDGKEWGCLGVEMNDPKWRER